MAELLAELLLHAKFKYFYPDQFFDPVLEAGKKYTYILENIQELQTKKNCGGPRNLVSL